VGFDKGKGNTNKVEPKQTSKLKTKPNQLEKGNHRKHHATTLAKDTQRAPK
jgi:hypothetical protein